jgi:uncharacterized protein (DUF433 family)
MTTTVHPIQKTQGICGGYARIRDTRIPVWSLVSLRLQGANEEYLLRNYPSLTAHDISVAWQYYTDHQTEIDQLIANHSD